MPAIAQFNKTRDAYWSMRHVHKDFIHKNVIFEKDTEITGYQSNMTKNIVNMSCTKKQYYN